MFNYPRLKFDEESIADGFGTRGDSLPLEIRPRRSVRCTAELHNKQILKVKTTVTSVAQAESNPMFSWSRDGYLHGIDGARYN